MGGRGTWLGAKGPLGPDTEHLGASLPKSIVGHIEAMPRVALGGGQRDILRLGVRVCIRADHGPTRLRKTL